MYKRILLKISGEALSGQEAPIGFDKVNAAAAEIASLAQKGLELGIVVGGGNIIRGRDAGSRDRNRMDHMGMRWPCRTVWSGRGSPAGCFPP